MWSKIKYDWYLTYIAYYDKKILSPSGRYFVLGHSFVEDEKDTFLFKYFEIKKSDKEGEYFKIEWIKTINILEKLKVEKSKIEYAYGSVYEIDDNLNTYIILKEDTYDNVTYKYSYDYKVFFNFKDISESIKNSELVKAANVTGAGLNF